MANLKTLSGFPIQNLTSDPVPYAQALADNPYAGVWSSGGSLNTARTGVGGGAVGTQTASITGGGNTSGATAVSEQYNGTSWTETSDLNIARYDFQKFGTSTAALHCGGEGLSSPPYPQTTAALVESWNGSSWTETTDMPAAKRNGGGAGTSTSGLVYGGNATPAAPRTAASYEWDGSSWTAGGNMNTTRRYFGSYGTQTAAQAVSGDTPPYATQVEQYNGTSWTEIAEINTARAGVAGNGTTTSALVYGGNNGSIRAFTESWDGSSWTEVADLATAVQYHGSGGANNLSGLSFGGGTPSNTAATEEWAFSGLPPSTPAAGYSDAIVGQMYYNSTSGQFKNVGLGTGSWASGGNLNTRRFGPAGGGLASSQTAAIAFGGDQMPTEPRMVGNTEIYDGSSWTEVNDLNSDRGQLGGAGSTTAALAFGGEGEPPSFTTQAITENWNGSSWTEVNDLNTARKAMAGFGTNTAALAAGGNPGNTVNTESWNGSSWTEVNNLNVGASRKGTGTQTLGLAFGGGPSGPTFVNAEEWNGSSWTAVSDMNSGKSNAAGFGTYRNALVAGGTSVPGGYQAIAEHWDGTSWTELADLSSGRNNMSPAGNFTSGLVAGGFSPPGTPSYGIALTEEWNKPDFAIKTVTTS